jgi:hypothetical protein
MSNLVEETQSLQRLKQHGSTSEHFLTSTPAIELH